ncbi:MAG TPA: histidine kinase, partial [Anaerolineales bacterium]
GVDRLMYGKLGVVPNSSFHHPTENEHLDQNFRSAPAATPLVHSPAFWLGFARLAWYSVFAIALGLFIASIPGFFIIGSGGITDPRFSASPSPLSRILDWITILGAMAAGLLSLSLAALLFRRRSGDLMALMTSFYLLAYGVIMAGPLEALEPFFLGIAVFTQNVLMPGFVPFSLLLFAVFPDGRFVPRWTRWAVLAAFLAIPFALFWTSRYTRSPVDFSQPVVLISTGVVIVLAAAVWLSTLYAQIYRYRNVSTAEQRQQTKWVVYGTGVWLSLQMILTVPWVYSFSLPPGTPFPWWLAAAGLLWVLFLAVIPVTLTIAVMRYRLFKIDIIINRTLVYGALTASVVAMYALLVGALGVLLHAQGNLIISLLATGLVAVLFQPLRARLQRGINRMMYGERDDPATVFARLGDLLEASASPQETLPGLVRTIGQTLKLPYAAIELGKDGDRGVAAAYGIPSVNYERFALVYQSELVGSLVVAYRSQGEEFTQADRQLLENISHQAGAVAHAVHLTNELQRSRLRLVTAREEERRRLRRDLHDELGPQLASQALIIDALEKRLRQDPVSASRLLEELKKQSQRAVQDIRQIIYDLRPPALDDLGLVGAIREILAGYQRSGVSFHFQATEDMPPLPAAVEVATYRIIQEAATNVIRHAKAKSCSVRINYHNLDEGSELRLVIADDGIGLQKERHNGVGLNSMRERAAELGGDFKIASLGEGGTRVSVRLPITREEA